MFSPNFLSMCLILKGTKNLKLNSENTSDLDDIFTENLRSQNLYANLSWDKDCGKWNAAKFVNV
jgi:hypothetical protein